jgi:hypothetical protein
MTYGSAVKRFISPILLLALVPSCQDAWVNTIFPLGGNTPGGRGIMTVVFVNDTQFRAIFTFGTYDPQDQTSVPQFGQFAVDPEQDETVFNRGLDPDTVTPQGSFVVNCGRVFSLGGQELIDRINEQKDPTPVNQAPVVEAALRAGVFFTSAPLDSPDANAVENFDIRLDPAPSLLGVDYACDSLLIYTFEPDPDNPGQVRVRLDVIEATQP